MTLKRAASGQAPFPALQLHPGPGIVGLCEPFPGMILGSWACPLPYAYLAPTLPPSSTPQAHSLALQSAS